MRGFPAIASSDTHRVRRWDVLMLGSALPGLIAAVRLGQRGLRVLVLEERGGESDDFAREPFLLVDAESHGLLSGCLRAMGIALIDQRRFVAEDVALQVCDAERRVDLGRTSHTAEEWSSWGLVSRDDARRFAAALDEAAEAERAALLEAPALLRTARRAREALAPARRAGPARGWPSALASAPPALRALLDAPVRSLSNLGDREPSPEARARLIGGLLRGGVAMSGGDGFLRGLLRRRITTLYGEFRALEGGFRIVSVQQQPGIAVGGAKEIWTGRALLLNAPAAAVAAAADEPLPSPFDAPPIRWRRHTVHYRGPREQVAPSMADRVIWRDDDEDESVALRVFRGRSRTAGFDLLASAVVPVDDVDAERRGEARIERALRDLLPFSEGALERVPLPRLRWDSDALLADPTGAAWPEEPELRLSARPAVYGLDRACVGGLGGEGEVWLGWRAGDAIAEELR
jgi:phytoene dehydrogenase-like protein